MSAKPFILVVDDDGPILLLMKNLLREFGFDSATAATGAEALELARERQPNLVLLDKNMPGMTGEEVVRALRAEEGMGAVPILILSGEPVSPPELQALGANGSVLKPFDVQGLIETIRKHLG